MEEKVPEGIVAYMECVKIMAKWCLIRAEVGDVDVPTLAHIFADNVIKAAKTKMN